MRKDTIMVVIKKEEEEREKKKRRQETHLRSIIQVYGAHTIQNIYKTTNETI